ncbi:reverse transcriptase domain-containing protein [Tanacetum coccineum]
MHHEKVQQDKLKSVEARLNFGDCSKRNSKTPDESQYSESKTLTTKEEPTIRQRHRHSHSPQPTGSVFLRLKRDGSASPRQRSKERREGGVFKRLGNKAAHSESRYRSSRSRETDVMPKRRYHGGTSSRVTEGFSEIEDSGGGHWKSKSKRQKSSIVEDDFHIKTHDGSKDPEDHLKIFQAAAKTERWALLTWCHMFNSTLTGDTRVRFDDLSPESVDSYDDLIKAFLENYLQQKKCIKDPVEINHIKQRDGESTEEFVRRYKLECRDVKEAPEFMKIS